MGKKICYQIVIPFSLGHLPFHSGVEMQYLCIYVYAELSLHTRDKSPLVWVNDLPDALLDLISYRFVFGFSSLRSSGILVYRPLSLLCLLQKRSFVGSPPFSYFE